MSFYLILDKAQIHKKREFLSSAEIRFHSFVSDQQLSLHGLNQLTRTTDQDERRSLVRSIGQDVLSRWVSVRADNIKAKHIFLFGDTGRVLHKSRSIPRSLDWIMMVVEDDTDVRSLGDDIDKILPDNKIDSVVGHVLTLAATAASPQSAAAIALSKFLIRGVTTLLRNNEDDQVGLIEQSFIRELHYPTAKRTAAGVQDLTGNMWYDYTIFGISE